MQLVDTPNTKTIADLVERFKQPIDKTVKTLIVHAAPNSDSDLVALMVRGDHELNEIKAAKLTQVHSPLVMATEEEIRKVVGAGPGSLGPVNLPIPVIIDRTVAHMADFGAGANIDDKHYFGINWERDLPLPEVADLRSVVDGDPSPDGQGTLHIKRGIEVGHIFQLGDKYSQAMNCTVLDEQGQQQVLTMGCYGIGVSRVVAAAIEQNHDDSGIIWPAGIAPFEVALCPIGYDKSDAVREHTDRLYNNLKDLGIDVLIDDRGARPGVMFADMELIGIPHRVVIGERGINNGALEYKGRRDEKSSDVAMDDIVTFLQSKLPV